MIEEIIIKYLNSKLEVKSYTDVPKNGTSFILVEKIGSGKLNLINTANIAIQSYDESTNKAASLNEKVKKAMEEMIELNDVSKVRLETDYNFTDTSLKKYRYQAIFEITY